MAYTSENASSRPSPAGLLEQAPLIPAEAKNLPIHVYPVPTLLEPAWVGRLRPIMQRWGSRAPSSCYRPIEPVRLPITGSSLLEPSQQGSRSTAPYLASSRPAHRALRSPISAPIPPCTTAAPLACSPTPQHPKASQITNQLQVSPMEILWTTAKLRPCSRSKNAPPKKLKKDLAERLRIPTLFLPFD